MNVCMILLTGLGDVVHGLPIVNAIKRAQPDSHITWVVEPMPSGVLRPHPAVDDVIVFQKKRGLRGIRQLRRDMKRRRFDVALNFNIYTKSVWPMLFSRAPRRIGFGRGRAREGVWLFANEHVPAGPRKHTQDMFLEFLDVLKVSREPIEWRIAITASERLDQDAFFAPLRERPVIGVVPASSKLSKDWPAQRYPELVDALAEQCNAHVVLLGGPSEHEREVARMIVDGARNRPVVALGDSVRRLIWLIDGCQLIIAPDTGPVHIARALDVPVVGLYGRSNPWRVGPWRSSEDLWIDKYTEPGAAPDASGFYPKSVERMQQITVAEILEKVRCAL
jgi:heptosyltransferase I